MRVHEFLDLVAVATRAQLPAPWRAFRTRKRYTLIQLYYARRTLHYEVWIRGRERLLEIGLHFESDAETNRALRDYFARRVFEIKEALGDAIEIEQWTARWARVHQLLPYQQLDSATACRVGQRLAQMITFLQPLLESALHSPTSSRATATRPRARV